MANSPTRGRSVASRFLAALEYGDFQTLWTANFFAGAAAWALIVARGWIVYEFSDSSLWVGVVTFAAMIPRVAVSPFTGYLSDRFDRRTVLRVMFAINLLHNLVLGFLMLSGSAEIWHIVVLSVVNGSARAAQMPAGQALIPNLVPRTLLLNAIALNQATMHGSRLLGPLAIIPLLATTGTTGAIFLCAGFYAISLVQTMRLRTASTGVINKRQSFARNFSEGAVYVYKTPILFSVVVMAIFHCGLVMSFESLLPVLSTKLLDSGDGGAGFLLSADADIERIGRRFQRSDDGGGSGRAVVGDNPGGNQQRCYEGASFLRFRGDERPVLAGARPVSEPRNRTSERDSAWRQLGGVYDADAYYDSDYRSRRRARARGGDLFGAYRRDDGVVQFAERRACRLCGSAADTHGHGLRFRSHRNGQLAIRDDEGHIQGRGCTLRAGGGLIE